MNILSGTTDFFGLDIGTTAIRLVELRGSGSNKMLVKYAYVPIDPKVVLSDSKSDQQKLSQAIADLVGQARLTTTNVAVGLPSQRVFSTVVDFERLSPSDTAKAIRYQADSLIPTPMESSKLDWAVIGASPADATKVEVLITSVENIFVEQRLDMLEAIGLNVIAFEPDSFALARSLIPHDSQLPQMVIDMGSRATDLVVVAGGAPRLVRSIQTGSETLVRTGAQNLNVDDKQAEQFIFKFGLGRDKLEGRVYEAIIGTIDVLTAEIEKSIKFYQTRYPESRLDRIVVTGAASAIPEYPVYLANKFNMNIEIGNAWRNVMYSQDRQNELLAVSNHFGVAVGLAERVE
jgi:type IV pilus assembly protein PilM